MNTEQAANLTALKDHVRQYFTGHITTNFFKAAEGVVACVKNMEKAIPESYEKLVEQRSLGQIKAVLFSRRTHEAVTSQQDMASQGVDAMRLVVKSAGHVMTGQVLGKFRSLEVALKSVRTYTTTVHGINILLHKLPPAGKQNRERAAMLREPLDPI